MIKQKGSIMMEPLVSLGIISMVLLISILIFSNLSRGNKSFLITLSKNEISNLQMQENWESDVYNYETFTIEKTVSKYRNSIDLYEIEWEVYDLENVLIYSFKEVVIKYD